MQVGICSLCNRERNVKYSKQINKLVCETCRRGKLDAMVCSRCGHKRKVACKINGEPICQMCCREDQIGKCPICKREKPLIYKDKRGRKICDLCYLDNNQEECVCCHNILPVHKRDENGPICRPCYNKNREKEPCAECGRLRIVCYRDEHGPLCDTCRERKKRREKIEMAKDRRCDCCGELKPDNSTFKESGICDDCDRIHCAPDENPFQFRTLAKKA